MRSRANTVLLGSFIASTCVFGQSLTEHAAAAAGATIGTAAGKPLGTALGKIFGDMDKSTSTAATPKPKPAAAKPTAAAPPETTEHAAIPLVAPVGGGDAAIGGGGGGSSHRTARRRELFVESGPVAAAAPVVPVVVPPVVKEPSVEDVANIKVGATASELRATLGAPESRVSIPGDDGHLLEICQYWAKGEPVGTVRLDNGRVISVQSRD
jgi:hypothetical protein